MPQFFFFAVGCAVVVVAWCMNPTVGDGRSKGKETPKGELGNTEGGCA